MKSASGRSWVNIIYKVHEVYFNFIFELLTSEGIQKSFLVSYTWHHCSRAISHILPLTATRSPAQVTIFCVGQWGEVDGARGFKYAVYTSKTHFFQHVLPIILQHPERRTTSSHVTAGELTGVDGTTYVDVSSTRDVVTAIWCCPVVLGTCSLNRCRPGDRQRIGRAI